MNTLEAPCIPCLRDDISIVRKSDSTDGVSTWIMHDPVQNRFFKISDGVKDIISNWSAGLEFSQMKDRLNSQLGIGIGDHELLQLLEFMNKSNLLAIDQTDGWKLISHQKKAETAGWSKRIFFGYLFFRIPLIKPEKILSALSPLVDIAYSKWFYFALSLFGVIGIYMSLFEITSRFDHHAGQLYTYGLLDAGLAIILLKICHEFGHAITAYRYGCRVPTMGIAFMVFIPLLYTDVTDSWSLPSKAQKIKISAAGVIAELILAVLATFLWIFLEDGMAKNITFYTATIGWISSVGFNLNPFMKFDGYYILSDLIGIENLQSRAFSLGRWKLRQILFSKWKSPPGTFTKNIQFLLISYAYLTWIYRLIIFTSIAVLIYYFFVKVIGVIFFIAAIGQLFAIPILKEIRVWNNYPKTDLSLKKLFISCSILTLLCLSVLLPISGTVRVPVILQEKGLHYVFPPRSGKIASVNIVNGQAVEAGFPLFTLNVTELNTEITKIELRASSVSKQLKGAISDRVNRSQQLLLQQKFKSLENRLAELRQQVTELKVISQSQGEIIQISKKLRPGVWLSSEDFVALIRSGHDQILRGYIHEQDLSRIEIGAVGTFIPNDITRPSRPVKFTFFSQDAAKTIDIQELASIYGGSIQVHMKNRNNITPLDTHYFAEFDTIEDDLYLMNQTITGTVLVNAARESIVSLIWRKISKVLVKEANF